MTAKFNLTLLKLFSAALLLTNLGTACSRSEMRIATTEPATATTAPPAPPAPTRSPTPQVVVIPGAAGHTYEVVWIQQGETLIVRQPAGISSVGIDALPLDGRDIRLTGKTTMLGSSQWVEIHRSDGGTGWVNGWNLTEEFVNGDFCSDTRVLDLLTNLVQAIAQSDGDALTELASPRRGLIIRHDWWNPEVRFRHIEVGTIFTDVEPRDWGIIRDSELQIIGTFDEIILPKWLNVLDAAPEVECNVLNLGTTAQPAEWPAEYSNLNFYSFYRKAPEPGNQFNWRTWGIGIEYVGGEPYVVVLIQFEGEI